MEAERDAIEAMSPDVEESKFEKMLGEAMVSIEELMLVVITDSDRTVVFREAMTMFHEPRFEEALIDKCYDAFEDTKRLQIGAGHVLTMFYGAMVVVQFRVGSFYGTIVGDSFVNMGLVHILVKRIRSSLAVFAKLTKEVANDSSNSSERDHGVQRQVDPARGHRSAADRGSAAFQT
ncbi:hypothetical protein GGF46_000242 [Coemansia sp. RSA 552]|nr:hypothetical protein GGF46_000242 [Coemansia sp. RSA 552]